MRVEQDDVRVRIALDDRPQDCRDGAGFARAGRADNAEMLAEQVIDQEEGGDGGVLMDRADGDRGFARRRVDLGQIVRGRQVDAVLEPGNAETPRRNPSVLPDGE
jgi:hypothetical protein